MKSACKIPFLIWNKKGVGNMQELRKDSEPAINGEMGGSKFFPWNTNAMALSFPPQTFSLPSPIPQWPQGGNLSYQPFP